MADTATTRHRLDNGNDGNNDNNMMMMQTILLDRIHRGGYTPPTSSSVDSKKKRKKKKPTKAKQQDTKKAETPSSPPPPTTTTTSSKHQQEHVGSNLSDSDEPTAYPPQFNTSGTNPSSSSADSVNGNDANSSSSSSASSSSQQQSQDKHQLPSAVQSILEQTCHYDVLGITKAASQIEIQKAFRRRCLLTHPDKIRGGERTAFDKVSEAYDVLSCEKKRAIYDRYGKAGLENNNGSNNGMDFRFGSATSGTSFFGNDLFREFFGQQQQQQQQSSNAFRWSQQQHPPPPRNRDLRYQLEVSLEELYTGSTKRVAIQQPNPVRPYFPYRKELEISLPRGIGNGQSVRISGVVDSVSDAPPADVIFLIRERRHPVFTRRGHDLAMEVKISFSEAIVGYRRKITCLDGRTITIGSPYVRNVVVQKMNLVDDVPPLPLEKVEEDSSDADDVNDYDVHAVQEQRQQRLPIPLPPEKQATKPTILSYDLPPSILQTGDVHVLKGYGMPKRRGGGHHYDDQYGDLYIQYVVGMPLESSSSSLSASATSTSNYINAANLSPEERMELARLLCKLEGRNDDPTRDIVHSSSINGDATVTADGIFEGGEDESDLVHFLSVASASDFGNSNTAYDDHYDHDEHLRHDDDEDGVGGNGVHHQSHHQDISDFFRRAFTAGRASSPFGFGGTTSGGGSGGGFHYFSSGSGGRGYGGEREEEAEEEDHKVECNQM